MSFLDALLGRSRPARSRTDALYDLSTVWLSLRGELDWEPAGRAGIVLRPVSGHDFGQAETETNDLMKLAGQEMGSLIETTRDEYGYLWMIVQDHDWEDLVAMVHTAGKALQEKGFGGQLLAAVFRFRLQQRASDPLYLVYSYKRGAFYPFSPKEGPNGQERHHTEEMRLYAVMEKELSWEKDLSRWYPLWGCPV